MSTTNLAMTVINASDYVSPDPINANFEILDALGVEYVTDAGTVGEWWYRKWKSGRLECGIDDKNFGDLPHTTAWGSMYSTAQKSFGAYPFAFASRPFVMVTFNSTTGGTDHASYVATVATASTTDSPKFFLVDPNSNTAKATHFGIYVCGKYKS